MRYFGKTTYLTQGAPKEQLELEKRIHDLEVKLNYATLVGVVFMLTIIGAPIGLLILLICLIPYVKLIRLQNELHQFIIDNADEINK